MADALTSLRNIGPATAEALRAVGIADAGALRALGAHEAYRRLVAGGHPPHFIGYYVLAMALQGRPWNDCRGAEKAALRQAFDALLAEAGNDPDRRIEAELDLLGVRRNDRKGERDPAQR